MNAEVRSYLIEAARQKSKFVFYSDVVRDCHLNIDTNTEYGRKQLSEVLGEVSAYENSQVPARPLLSSLAIYKDQAKNDHGDGFYKVAEKLGKGSFKELKERLYAFSEAEACRVFWQKGDNYRNFASISSSPLKERNSFFNNNELTFFKQWQYKPYNADNKEHVQAKNYLMDTVWEKTLFLGREIVKRVPGFQLEGGKYWSQRGWKDVEDGNKVQAAIIKPYTWVKVFRNTDRGKDIFFTFGLDASTGIEAFIYKIDCQEKRDSTLSQAQLDLCRLLIPETAQWNVISFDDLLISNWNSLIDTCVDFVNAHIEHYVEIIKAVWGEPVQPHLFKNKLIKKEKPKDGYDSIPDRKRNFKGVEVDFQDKVKEQKDLGDKGEELVKQREIEFLTAKNMASKAALVKIVQDGEGYDVYSFDESGNDKYIEVKTTPGNEYTPFYLSENEIDFLRLYFKQYVIYRLYNYDADNHFAEFYELSGDIEDQVLMKPTQYKVLIRKEI